MFSKSDKVGNIEYLERKLQQLGESQANSTGYWLKLSEHCAKLSADQLKYVNNCDKVKKAKSKMMDAFNLYLFEKFKDEFAKLPNMQSFCDDYIEAIITATDDYSNNIQNALLENEQLKQRIAELEKLNDKVNTKRVG
jgi:hypothetical protein